MNGPSIRAAAGDAGGHSLVEAAVALALMITVLAPLAGLVANLSLDRRSRCEVEALALAQQAMEETLHRRRYVPETHAVQDGAWQVRRDVRQEGTRVTVTIRVYRWGAALPTVVLTTVRLL